MANAAVKEKKQPEDMVDLSKGSEINEEKSKDKKKKIDLKKKKKKSPLGFIFFLLIIGALVAVLGFNVLNLREKYLRTTIDKIPVVKNLLPATEEEQTPENEYSKFSKNELIAQNQEFEKKAEEAENENKQLWEQINSLNAEIEVLKAVEDNQLKFKADKEAFDKMVAENDPEAYKSFYKEIAPENAEKIYSELVSKEQTDKQLKKYIQTFEGMKKDASAKVLKQMMGTDMDLVVQILDNISSEQRGNILSTMEPKDAAACAKRLAPKSK